MLFRSDGSDGHLVLSPELLATISAWIAITDNQDLLGPTDYLDWYQEMWAYYMGWKDAREKCHQRALKALDEYYTAFPELLAEFAPQGHGIAASRLPGGPVAPPQREWSPACFPLAIVIKCARFHERELFLPGCGGEGLE